MQNTNETKLFIIDSDEMYVNEDSLKKVGGEYSYTTTQIPMMEHTKLWREAQ